MAKLPKGGKNAQKGEPSNGVFPEVTRDLFSEFPANDMALDFGEVNPKALHSVVARVCGVGGYIGFSAPAGGAAVKLRCTIGDASGERWTRTGVELSAFLLAIHKLLEGSEPAGVGRADSGGS